MIMMLQLLGKGKKWKQLPQRTPENEDHTEQWGLNVCS